MQAKEKYDVVIGLEVHARLNTLSKAFSADPNSFGSGPNQNVSVISLAEEMDLLKETGKDIILKRVRKTLDKYPDKILEYHKGKKGLLGLFMGEVMKLSGGKTDPAIANKTILEELQKRKA